MDKMSLHEYAQSLVEIMPEVIRGLWKREMDQFSRGSITPPQIFILIYLNKVEELRMTDVARYLSVTTAAATGLIDRLVKSGYISRVYDPADRRIIKVKLTAKGVEAVKKIMMDKVSRIKAVLGRLPDRDRADYLRILRAIKDILAQEPEKVCNA